MATGTDNASLADELAVQVVKLAEARLSLHSTLLLNQNMLEAARMEHVHSR